MRPAPRISLLILVGMLMPLGLLVAARIELSWLLAVGSVAVVLMGLVDLLSSADRLNGLVVKADPLTRLARDVEGKLAIHLCFEQHRPKELTLGLPLPVEFVQTNEVQRIALAGKDASRWTVEWKIVAQARGVFRGTELYVEVPSKWGLFNIRRRYSIDAEIRVYPNMRRERRQMANLFLNRGSIGVHAQRMVGQGREYEQLREYSSGDSMLDIHWKASAKRGELVTKTYQVERTQEIYLIIDHSRLSGVRTRRRDTDDESTYKETFLERYVTAASVLSMVSEREGDLFGMVAFGQRVSRFVRASGGKQHGQVIQNALFDLKTERGPFDLDELFTFLRLRLRRRALLIFLTDLSDSAAAEEFSRHIGMVAGHHYVMVNSIRREGVHPIYESPIEEPVSLSDEIAGHLRWEGLNHLKTQLRTAGVDFSVIDDEKLSLDLVNQYLSVKQRQVL
jgi:uncharacterized protein (DUF58 family)